MEGEMECLISSSMVSDSNSSTHQHPASKEGRYVGSSLKFKGVVPQQNGHWGAQIYANHQRIWLGTFKAEKEAAMAYDSAAIKLRSGDCHRNFPWTNITVEEPKFQCLYSSEAVLNMIRDGSYASKFADYIRTRSQSVQAGVGLNPATAPGNVGVLFKQMFQKELTPSDVGKLNRLVIPKKYAVKFFPNMFQDAEELMIDGKAGGVQLVFYDRSMRQWKFRYCYWSSSQSFVFTSGWSRFVKENHLKANDTITFYNCKAEEAGAFFMIEADKVESNTVTGTLKMSNQCVETQAELQLGGVADKECGRVVEEDEEPMQAEPTCDGERKCLKLFGVHIMI
ncbi:AP2/ERF and B3 domain-containing transcription factor [Tripterygium wilfordii]|uniref:AP2/ERF and B3 domain-containing transcription factor n=1 Tax=Tripterygium wilfordii TaxID=458696 RepID=A0A7J7D6W8_TRIWF|nr:AP2/ERF and B3 domain-containing transcription factor At1g50680-like [Tripterygium wilfordii]XP_038712312.1 AP2/ERF and B3 domain-containing transcription factor At1g50680-like [Tripterygium wilfordii]XP_038712313.1 AP2/ERF and B3 domain-containing transcription factor At1g50680-like [Tripterygium wilfordii]KAF5742072.1 AP2/ERF and B3 domain-containing transcription factor [Tripterygium wilfordii]